MFYPSPSPSHGALPSSSSSSSSSTSSKSCSSSTPTPTPTPTPAPSTTASYYTSFRASSATSKSASHFAPAPRAPSKDFLPLPSVAEYRSGLSTPTASPAPSSRRTTSSISPANIKFNPILTSPSPSSRFNFLNPSTNTYSHDLAFPSGQVSSYIPVLCGPLNLLIYIQNPSSQMSCRDFLLAISTALAQPINPYTDDEWLQVGPHNQQAINSVYQKRVAKYPDPYLRKIDFLLEQTHFRGLRFAYNAWALIAE